VDNWNMYRYERDAENDRNKEGTKETRSSEKN
jgi:hypothetical protein